MRELATFDVTEAARAVGIDGRVSASAGLLALVNTARPEAREKSLGKLLAIVLLGPKCKRSTLRPGVELVETISGLRLAVARGVASDDGQPWIAIALELELLAAGPDAELATYSPRRPPTDVN